MNPVPFDEVFEVEGDVVVISDKLRGAYERGILKPDEQLFWIHNLNRSEANFDEPYDMGVLNALEVALLIFSEKDPSFEEKPGSPVELLEKLKKKDKSTQTKLQKLAKEKDVQISTLEAKLKKEQEIGKMLKAELKKAKASKK
jgi:hypothetical protein